MIKRYRKKPVTIEAIRWTGDNFDEIEVFCGNRTCWTCDYDGAMVVVVATLEGCHHASIGDYIIKGVKDECYPCKPDIFEMTYEEVDT